MDLSKFPDHVMQLQLFLSSVDPAAMTSVKHLRLTGSSYYVRNSTPPPTTIAVEVARHLAAACPNITFLAFGGFEGTEVLSLLGTLLPNICSVELTDESNSRGVAHPLIASHEPPPVPYTRSSAPLIDVLSLFPNLVQLEASGMCCLRQAWALSWLPLLEDFTCMRLPESMLELPDTGPEKMMALQALHIIEGHSDVSALSALLKVAPNLRTLTCEKATCTGTTMHLGQSLSRTEMESFQHVSSCLQSGLQLMGVHVARSWRDEEAYFDGAMSTELILLKDVLAGLQPLPTIIGCSLCLTSSCQSTPLSIGERRAQAMGSVSQLGRVLPNLEELKLYGDCPDEALLDLASCLKLEVLDLADAELGTVRGVIALLVRAPQITCVSGTNSLVKKLVEDSEEGGSGGESSGDDEAGLTSAQLREMLGVAHSAWTGGAGLASPMELGEWTVGTDEEDCSGSWVRNEL